jgi:hypothetical protein
MIISKFKTFDYLLVFILLLYSVSPFFIGDRVGKFIIFLVLVAIFNIKGLRIDREIYKVVLTIFIIGIVQGLIWNLQLSTLFFYIALIVLTPYLGLKIIGLSYLNILSRITLFFGIITLPIWILQNLYSPFDEYLLDLINLVFPFSFDLYPRSLIFYTYEKMTVEFVGITLYRNAGIFHEPGGYAIFLNIAIAINLLTEKKLFSLKNLFLIFLIFFTTFSTAGMISVFVIVLMYYARNQNLKVWQRITFIIIFGFVVTIVFRNSHFLQSKIVSRYETESTKELNQETAGRFFAARKSILVLTRYPITGRGLIEGSRVEQASEEDTGGYGFMAFFAQLGIVVSLLFAYYFYRAFNRISIRYTNTKTFSNIFFLSLVVGLFSQSYISTPIISMIFYIGLLDSFSYKKI